MLARAWVLGAMFAGAAHAGGAALDYHGTSLARQAVERMAARALANPADRIELSRFLGAVVEELQAQGHLDARATAVWEGASRLRVDVAEGTRYRLGRVDLQASSVPESLAAAAALGVTVGQWASPRAVGLAIERGVARLVDQGHAYAALGVSRWDRDTLGRVSLALNAAPGPLVTVSALRFEGARVTRARLLERAAGPLAGLPFAPARAEAARARLAQLGLFDAVAYQGLESEGDGSRARLVYRVAEPRYHRFEGAFGLQGDAGAVGLVKLGLDNLLGTGRATALDWESRGRGVSQLGARYAEPLLFGAPLRVEVAFEQRVQDTLFVRTRFGAKARYALGTSEWIEGGFEEERVVQTRQAVRHARIQVSRFALEHDDRDAPTAPRHGGRVRIEASQRRKHEDLRPSGSRATRSSAIELGAEWHRPWGTRAGVAVELSGAGRFGGEAVLPFYDRYPLGGAASLRGHDEEAYRVDRYALSRLEWRWFLGAGAERVFAFWDHAEAGTREARPAGGTSWRRLSSDGIGFGLRVPTAGGLAGLDYGVPPGRPPLEGKIHLRLVSTF